MKSEKRLEEGYREMASDTEHEREAAEWCDALIGDSSESADSCLARNDKGYAPDALSGKKQAGLK
jgi:hypothetical protein